MKPPVKRDPIAAAIWEEPDVYALQAVAEGRANEQQQKRALKWIITECCGTYRSPFVRNESDTTAFLAGRADVGRQIGFLLALNMGTIAELRKQKPRKDTR